MVIQAEPIEFEEDDPRPLLKHLDQWATVALATPEQFADMAQRAGQWADYSARNQVLLASNGIVGAVAGASTWAQVPSVDNGRECAVRNGEHALQVRVPITTETGVGSARTAGDGFSSSVAGGFQWEPVFAVEQLARRPLPDALTPTAVPAMSDKEWSETVRKASTEIVGRRPHRIVSPEDQLGVLAARAPLSANRHQLPPVLAEQAAWLVADRVGRAVGPMPGFDPSGLKPRERWQRLEDVRKATDRVTRAVSNVLDIDLVESPLPRWAVADDRDVAPGHRNYLSRSDVAGLPGGMWSEVGPYSQPEWESRGRPEATGRAAFLKATPRSYLAVYETVVGAVWKLETAGRGRHLGLVAEGAADSMVEAKADARTALRERFPDIARVVEDTVAAPVLSPASGWVTLENARDERILNRTFDDRVAAVVAPGPGGRWGAWLSVDGNLTQAEQLAPTQADAVTMAEGLVRSAMVGHAAENPARAERMISDAAAVGPEHWDRSVLVDVLGPSMNDTDAALLASLELTLPALVELLADSGRVGPATILSVLHAEGADVHEAATLVPEVGLPIPTAVNDLSSLWGERRLDTATMLGATREDLVEAGASLAELLVHSPVETLRTLDTRTDTWARIGPVLMEAGLDATTALRQIADHAPNPETMAVAVESVTDASDLLSGRHAVTAVLGTIGSRVSPEDLAAVTERYGLDPHQAAAAMFGARVPRPETVQAVIVRVDGDRDAARGVMADSIGLNDTRFDEAVMPDVVPVLEFRSPDSVQPNADLLAALAPASELVDTTQDLASQLAVLSTKVEGVERSNPYADLEQGL